MVQLHIFVTHDRTIWDNFASSFSYSVFPSIVTWGLYEGVLRLMCWKCRIYSDVYFYFFNRKNSDKYIVASVFSQSNKRKSWGRSNRKQHDRYCFKGTSHAGMGKSTLTSEWSLVFIRACFRKQKAEEAKLWFLKTAFVENNRDLREGYQLRKVKTLIAGGGQIMFN